MKKLIVICISAIFIFSTTAMCFAGEVETNESLKGYSLGEENAENIAAAKISLFGVPVFQRGTYQKSSSQYIKLSAKSATLKNVTVNGKKYTGTLKYDRHTQSIYMKYVIIHFSTKVNGKTVSLTVDQTTKPQSITVGGVKYKKVK